MAAEENKALIHRFVETVWNGKDVDAFGEFHAATFTQNGAPTTTEQSIASLGGFFAETPDLHHTIEDIIAEGDRVAYRWIMRSTDKETGKQQAYRGITFMRIADGKIVDDWFNAEAIEE